MKQKAFLIGAAAVLPLLGVITAISAAADDTPAPPPVVATPAPRASTQPAATKRAVPPSGGCSRNYDKCVPIVAEVHCRGAKGAGRVVVQGPIRVIGEDVYHLDPDGDGIACE